MLVRVIGESFFLLLSVAKLLQEISVITEEILRHMPKPDWLEEYLSKAA